MQPIKRILAIIVMIISVLMLVLSIAGVIGVWVVRPQITTSLEAVAASAEIRVNNAKQGLDQLDSGLTSATKQVAEMEQNLQSFGENLEQNKPLLTKVTDGLESKLSPFLETAREIVTTIVEATAALNSTVETLNAFPFVSIPPPEVERIETLTQGFQELQAQVQDLRATIDQRQSEIIQGTVSMLTEPLSRITSRLDAMQTRISGYSGQLAAIQNGLTEFKTSIGRWLTYAAVLVTFILLWLAFSQVALFVLSWQFYTGRDLLVEISLAPNVDSPDVVKDTQAEE